MKTKALVNEFAFTWFICIATIVVVFFTPILVVNAYFIILCFLAFRSKENNIWIGVFVFIFTFPGRMFLGNHADFSFRLPIYRVLPGVSIGFEDIFPLMYLIKLYLRQKKSFTLTNIELTIISIIIFFTTFGILVGSSPSTLTNTLRHFLILSLYFPITRLVNHEQSLKLAKFVMSIILLSFAFQIFYFINGTSFAAFISGSSRFDRLAFGTEITAVDYLGQSRMVRYTESINILYLTLVSSLFFLFHKKQYFNKTYLLLISFLSCLIMLLSATRGWSLAFLATFVSFVLLQVRKTKLLFQAVAIFFTIVIAINLLYPVAIIQIRNSFLRLLTARAIVQFDTSLGGTDQRFERGAKMISAIKESPLIGFGASDYAFEKFDNDVGIYSLLIMIGFLGYFLLIMISVMYIVKLFRQFRYDRSYYIFIIGVIGLWFMHSTTNIMFSLFKTGYATYWLPFYLGITNLILRSCSDYDNKIG